MARVEAPFDASPRLDAREPLAVLTQDAPPRAQTTKRVDDLGLRIRKIDAELIKCREQVRRSLPGAPRWRAVTVCPLRAVYGG